MAKIKFVSIDGAKLMRIHLQTVGDKKNPPIIFLHGLFGQGDDFLSFANHLSDRFYSILVDLPGHGQSEVIEGNSFNELCKIILESLPQTSQKSILIGYSLGGRIALYLTQEFPQFFEKAVIISANPGLDNGREDRLKEDLFLLDNISSPEDFFREWYAKPLFGNLTAHKDFFLLLQKRKNSNLEIIKKCLGAFSVGSQPSLWNKLQKNTLAIFYFCGEKDKKYQKIGQRISQYPSINLIEFENAGHYLHFEYPTDFHKQLVSLIRH
jgi:2-succinyl-6-hydroxy-2,4-cyclohexadiene-1-carboxylate synthase